MSSCHGRDDGVAHLREEGQQRGREHDLNLDVEAGGGQERDVCHAITVPSLC